LTHHHYRPARDVRRAGADPRNQYGDGSEENELGVSCIAVPVFDIHHRVPYAISISLSTSRLKQIGEKTAQTAA
jgi:DNA-binding IclR family transcriptional regulator